MFLNNTCPPTHSFATGTEHGGQSPKWQVWEAGWPHGWGTKQGWGHDGAGVPQGTGGGIDVFPQAHMRSVNVVSRHGGQCPLWHSNWQECCPHRSLFPQGMEHKWGSQSLPKSSPPGLERGQQRSLHRCLPQFFFLPQDLSQTKISASLETL